MTKTPPHNVEPIPMALTWPKRLSRLLWVGGVVLILMLMTAWGPIALQSNVAGFLAKNSTAQNMSIEQMELIKAAEHLRPGYDRDYGGYTGPWIEDYFFEKYMSTAHSDEEPLYLPVFWTNIQITGTEEEKARWKALAQKFVAEHIKSDRSYFAVIQFKKGTALLDLALPANVRIFSAGGATQSDFPQGNHVTTVPLIKGELKPHNPPLPKLQDHFVVTTINKTAPVRAKMTKMLSGRRDFHYKQYVGPLFAQVLEQAIYVLCPRGSGRTSWRLAETLQLGSIPVHIWTEEEVLPYNDVNTFMWESVGMSVHLDYVAVLPELLGAQSTRTVAARLANGRRLRHWFTLPGTVEYILRTVAGEDVLF